MAGVWDALAECICRPPRDEYEESQLFGGRGVFSIGGVECCRCDFEIVNSRGQTLKASHYLPLSVQGVAAASGSSGGGGSAGSGSGSARGGAGAATSNSSNSSSGGPLPCVVYCHCNSGSRRDAEEAVVHLLPMGVGVLAFDAAGSGLSDGDWVTLGAREAEDLACVVRHLRASGAVSTLAVWGRSMGAVTALLFAARAEEAREQGLCAVVCDSPFARLSDLILEIIRAQRLPVPGVLLKGALALMRGTVRRKAAFDLREASPLDVAPQCRVPCVFGHALADSFIPVSHSERLAAAYGTAAGVEEGGEGGGEANSGGGGSRGADAAAAAAAGAAAAATTTTPPFSSAAAATTTTTTTATTTPTTKTVYRNLIRFGGDHNHVRPPLFYASVCCFLHVHLRLDEVLVGGNPLKGLAQAAAALQRQHEREQEQQQRRHLARPGGLGGGGGDGGGAFSRGNSAVLPDEAPAAARRDKPPRPPAVAVPVQAGAGAAESSPSTSGSPLRRWWSSRNASLRGRSSSSSASTSVGGARAASPQKQQQPAARAPSPPPPLPPLPPASVDLGASAAIGEDVAVTAAAEAAMRALNGDADDEAAADGPGGGGGGSGRGGQQHPAFGGLQMMPSGSIDRAGGFTTASPGSSGAPGQGLDPHLQLAQALHHAVAPTTTDARARGAGRAGGARRAGARRAGGALDDEAEFQRQLSAAIERSLRETRASVGAEGGEDQDDAEEREVLARVLALSLEQQQDNARGR